MNPRIRKLYGLSDTVLLVLEASVIVLRRLLDDTDQRSIEEKLRDLEYALPDFSEGRLDELTVAAQGLDEQKIAPWVGRFKTRNGQWFLRRMVGAGAYDRIDHALRSEGALLVIALRRAFRALIPMAVALDDASAFLTAKQLKSINGITTLEHTALKMLLQLDQQFDRLLDLDLPLDDVPIREDEARTFTADITSVAEQFRVLVTEGSEQRIEALNETLARKIAGARYALHHSPDGISQAANSLIEFVDRLLRNAFPEDIVLAWLRANYVDLEGTTYKKDGKTVPTKKGQALCFVHRGLAVENESIFHQMAALGVAEARSRLQALKHAETGSPAEIDEMEKLLHAVEGYFLFAIRAGWIGASDSELADLRTRLEGKR
ncbi:hypothetical protein MT355_20145 [Rathayibacter sp. VKM Ac-2929]|uniref:hypothetical protein n=1 Tax=Rathayibacter sp. VKM Ac-2929 TaxID=2929480 RepID=UPI001FB32AD7|nr:hypothetical protein [Rathayibacter sp. VKM Ac-2929]MCJ1675583.1 hypothetical protein [Rathayibacter sp. VKM Ac-2929]